MQIEKPIYGTKEALEQGLPAPKSDAEVIAENAMRHEERLGDNSAIEVAESQEGRQNRLDSMSSRLGGIMLPDEVEDPRT